MGILNKFIKKITSSKDVNSITIHKSNVSADNTVMVHPDLENLLWIVDGPYKNYAPRDNKRTFEYNGIEISFVSFSSQEPSLISIKLPIQKVDSQLNIDRPPYYPTYAGLTELQRGMYWNLLANPYSGNIDIGYVFILYYGLERHLLEGEFEAAFRVILKLRDVYDNESFQSYSANALILTCLAKQRVDLIVEFYNSLDKSYELKFSNNLYLLCKYGLKIPLTPSDIIKISKTFGFSNQNYIKKYPNLFLEKMRETMINIIGSEQLDIGNYISSYDFVKIPTQELYIFANVSIRNESIDVPIISESLKFKKIVYDLLEQTHKNVKTSLAQMRKDGTCPAESPLEPTKKVEVLAFDDLQEKILLEQYKKSSSNSLDKHFALIYLQDFYYKYRNINNKYLQLCIDYCMEDIELLPIMQSDYIIEEKERVLSLRSIYNEKELEKQLAEITAFNGNIPAFKRLSIIFEKDKQYSKAIEICNNAIEYYTDINMYNAVTEFEERKEKLEKKLSKLS